jgi:bleomycin hydrolase
MYWDKFEKANYFLEAIIDTADRSIDDRTIRSIFGGCVSDGGQWNMFVNIVRKYGLVPKVAMQENASSGNTGPMNGALTSRLRYAAKELRDMFAAGASLTELRAFKLEVLKDMHTILRMHLGNPPSKFNWQWKDEKKKVHTETNMTPKEFVKKYVTIPYEEYVCLVHDPRPSNPYFRTYTVEYLGNVAEGGIVKYLNIPIDMMKKIAFNTIKGGEPVWFGCDCGQQFHRDMSIWDDEMYNPENFYGMKTRFRDKAERLLYKLTAMNHAMLFTGVHIKNGKPVKWRVENSWGTKGAGGGFYTMMDSWFDEHMFEIAARKSTLPKKLQDALKLPPIVLPAWDPMGSLAD